MYNITINTPLSREALKMINVSEEFLQFFKDSIADMNCIPFSGDSDPTNSIFYFPISKISSFQVTKINGDEDA